MERTTRALVAGLIVALLGAFLAVAPAQAQAGETSWFVQQINDHRRSLGLSPLTVDGGLAASSVSWSRHLAETQNLQHDPNLAGAVCCWSTIGENVGRGPTKESVWQAFLASPVHRHNIEDPGFTHVGVGVVFDGGGQLWTTHRFMTRATTVASPAPVAAPAPAPPPTQVIVIPAPAPTTSAPPATVPATTTTTTSAPPPPPEPERPPLPPTNPDRVATMLDALHVLHVGDTEG